MKMEPIVSSETSAIRTQTPGNYPKRNKLHHYTKLTYCVQKKNDRHFNTVVWKIYRNLVNFTMKVIFVQNNSTLSFNTFKINCTKKSASHTLLTYQYCDRLFHTLCCQLVTAVAQVQSHSIPCWTYERTKRQWGGSSFEHVRLHLPVFSLPMFYHHLSLWLVQYTHLRLQ